MVGESGRKQKVGGGIHWISLVGEICTIPTVVNTLSAYCTSLPEFFRGKKFIRLSYLNAEKVG